MDFKYLSSYANREDKGDIKSISARGNVPSSNFGRLNKYEKHDNIFDFKTNFKKTQIKKPVGTTAIIKETNDEIKKRENSGKLGISLKDDKVVNEFQDSFIPKIKKKVYIDPQYYQHNLGRKNFYSKFRDQIRRKQAKGEDSKEESVQDIETEPLERLEEMEERQERNKKNE